MSLLTNIARNFAISSVALLALMLGMGVGYFIIFSIEWGAILGGIALAGSVVLISCSGWLQAARILMFLAGTSLAGAGATDLLNFPRSNEDVFPGFILGLAVGLLLARTIWGAGLNISNRAASTLFEPNGTIASLFWALLGFAILFIWGNTGTDEGLGSSLVGVLAGVVALIIQLLHHKRIGLRLTRPAKWIGSIAMVTFILFIAVVASDAFSLSIEMSFALFLMLLVGIILWNRKYATSVKPESTNFRLIGRQSIILMSFTIPATVLVFYFAQAVFNLTFNISPTEWAAEDVFPFKFGDEQFIELMMNDVYYFKPKMNAVMTTPDEFIQKLATDQWSYGEKIEQKNDWESGIENSRGILTARDAGKVIISYINYLSPAARAGYKRGDQIEPHAFKNVIQPKKYKVDEVMYHVIRRSDGNIGYLWIQDFSSAAIKGVDDAFKEYKLANVRELVIDLRYNGGGHLPLELANLIAGEKHAGQVIWHDIYPDKYQDNNQDILLSRSTASIPIERVFVLTTNDSCSASEQIINGLRPFMPVITIGQKTCGKPYFMDEIEHNGFAYDPVVGRVTNSLGKADFEDGIKPDCEIKEKFDHPVGMPGDTLLDAALFYQKHNACPIK